ncbi:MAG TPA: hypothetical protein VE422_09865 [Terriglobia bacterium]|nr:hypothetical protein [Terriglobia bacterium]
MKTAAVLIAIMLLASTASAQSATSAPVKASTSARLSDGQPNMQGLYTRSGVKALEAEPPFNPIDPGDKNPLSVSNRGDGLGPYPRIFGEGGNVLRGQQARVQRPTGIIFPADKKLPWRPEEDAKRRQYLLDMNPPKDLRHIELNSRCALPGLFEGEDGNNPYTILQPPGQVVILYDYNHTSRAIDLNRREHLGKNIRLFMGDSIGHWEGNTLVVDTTNFNGRVAYSREIPYLSEDLHTVERFTVVNENTIDYEVTIEDPKLFTGPWKVAGAFARASKDVESLEFACAEGSQTLQNIFGTPPAR